MLNATRIKTEIARARAAGKPHKVSDGEGRYLWCSPTGAASWRFKFAYGGKEQVGSLGPWPEITIKAARDAHFEARRLLATGINPNAKKAAEKKAAGETFERVAEQYLATRPDLAPRTRSKAEGILRLWLNPEIGAKPVNEISAPELLKALRKIEARGRLELAHKAKELAGRVFMYGIACSLCERNPAADLKLALKARPDVHLAAITKPAEVGQLLRSIEGYSGMPATHACLRLLPHIFLRSSEIRNARWAEIDLDNATWLIPAERMKGKLNKRRDHLVPLSRQAVAILRELQEVTGGDELVFPCIGPRSRTRSISENTLGAALRTLGYSSDVHTVHGFRSTASTLLHEQGFESRDIELQLAHVDSNKIRGIYNRSERLKERARMMQQWSDYLDSLRAGSSNVVPIRAARA